jgi:hypothetical protein
LAGGSRSAENPNTGHRVCDSTIAQQAIATLVAATTARALRLVPLRRNPNPSTMAAPTAMPRTKRSRYVRVSLTAAP